MEAISMPLATLIIQILGLPGLVFIIWHFDNKRDQRKEEMRHKELAEREKAIATTLSQYREDVAAIRRLYENNARLVEDYERTCNRLERIYSETMSVISLNTQTQTRLVDSINANDYCPAVRQMRG
ncbi:MAG: hypothetical protein M0036_05010 [Desulfobacteraceae bacterium]|nr:hypothetical protein [Desulfobacteraceae bacterium]